MVMAASMTVPSGDWELNILMLRIARELGDDDFQSMKFLCSGQKGIPKGVLEKLSTPQKFFTYLREQRMLSRDNLLLLQAFLWHIDRQDLHQLATDYARKVEDVLHFFAPDNQPECGFEHVKFHVQGDLDTFQRHELEELRGNVARLLFVPAEFVFVSGLEPSNSLLVTFMIQSFCAQMLKNIVESCQGTVLRKLGVDLLYFGEEEVSVQESPQLARKSSVQDEELAELFRRTQELEVKVAEMDIKALEEAEEQEKLDKELTDVRSKEMYFRGLLCEALDRRSSDSTVSGQNIIKTHLPVCLENGRFVI